MCLCALVWILMRVTEQWRLWRVTQPPVGSDTPTRPRPDCCDWSTHLERRLGDSKVYIIEKHALVTQGVELLSDKNNH